MKTRNSHGLLQLGREALAYCQCASALISGNKALFVSVRGKESSHIRMSDFGPCPGRLTAWFHFSTALLTYRPILNIFHGHCKLWVLNVVFSRWFMQHFLSSCSLMGCMCALYIPHYSLKNCKQLALSDQCHLNRRQKLIWFCVTTKYRVGNSYFDILFEIGESCE